MDLWGRTPLDWSRKETKDIPLRYSFQKTAMKMISMATKMAATTPPPRPPPEPPLECDPWYLYRRRTKWTDIGAIDSAFQESLCFVPGVNESALPVLLMSERGFEQINTRSVASPNSRHLSNYFHLQESRMYGFAWGLLVASPDAAIQRQAFTHA